MPPDSQPGADGGPFLQAHGGGVRAAALHYGIAVPEWLDLSTGINPRGWSVPALPAAVWSRLPEAGDGLEAAASAYYGCDSLLPVAGSQAAIQLLPRLWQPSRITMLSPAYREHADAWQMAGHDVVTVRADQLEASLPSTDILVLVNPNNPTGQAWSSRRLLDWHASLAARGGSLIVDEAFADTAPADSLAPQADRPGLIVLRSLGKFFGLAGIRAGFVCAEAVLLQKLAVLLGPWHVSHPARWVATAALQDSHWQDNSRLRLARDARRLQALLSACGLAPQGGCALFQWVPTPDALSAHEALARLGILTRLFADEPALRFGLPGAEAEWQRLADGLRRLSIDGVIGNRR